MAMQENHMMVTMLGEFSISLPNGGLLVQKGARSRKTQLLLGMLLSNRGKSVSQERLIELLWPDSECSDPANALKNQIYRARRLLDSFTGEKNEYILFSKNSYIWNTAISCTIDTEELLRISTAAGTINSLDEEHIRERITLYQQALRIYRGEFMANLAGEDWIYSQRSYFEGILIRCVLNLCQLLRTEGRIHEIISICERTLVYCPFQEEIHHILLMAYVRTKRHKKALEHYNSTSRLFSREMGMGLPESITELYAEIIRDIHWTEDDIQHIKTDISQAYPDKGAFLCEYPVFQQLCLVQGRSQARHDQILLLILLTVEDSETGLPSSSILKHIMQALQSSILDTLRKNDLVCRYSPSQFLLGVLVSDSDDGDVILDRIQAVFSRRFFKNKIILSAQTTVLD